MQGRVVVVKSIFQRKKKKAGKKIEDPNDETKVDSDEDTCAKASTQNVSYSPLIIHFIEGCHCSTGPLEISFFVQLL